MSLVKVESSEGITTITMARADKRNALSPELQAQLREAALRAGEEAKCGILFGHGENFCAGLDLAWAAENWKGGRSQRLPFNYNRNLHQEIIARGNTLVHVINGQVITVTIDDNPTERAASGILSLQLEGSGQIWYRNVYVKPLN